MAGIGAVIMLSGLVVNPWVGVYYQDYIENYRDVMLAYVWWSLGLGLLLVGLGLIAARRGREGWIGMAMTVAVLSLVLMADRALLVVFGLSYWVPDPVLGYRHRPDAVRVRGSRLLPALDERLRGMRIAINRYGHHDDDFPEAKPPSELRGLMLGDSVTMGDGMEKHDAIAHQLEVLLGQSDREYNTHQIINTGVEGYSTNHESAIFRESLVFAPNFVTVGLCLNDVTDPAVFDTYAMILIERGEAEGGLKLLRRAQGQRAGDARLHYHVAVALSRLGRPAEARAEVEAALRSDGSFAEASEARRLLRGLGGA